MPVKVTVLDSPPYVLAVYAGVVTRNELMQAATEILSQLTRHNTHALMAECSQMTGGHTVFDLYGLADWIAANAPHLKEAVVFPLLDLASENIKFWETACVNRGLRVRIFNDTEKALGWLTQ
jgi:hypothetical protein